MILVFVWHFAPNQLALFEDRVLCWLCYVTFTLPLTKDIFGNIFKKTKFILHLRHILGVLKFSWHIEIKIYYVYHITIHGIYW